MARRRVRPWVRYCCRGVDQRLGELVLLKDLKLVFVEVERKSWKLSYDGQASLLKGAFKGTQTICPAKHHCE